jgi:hypothetical protein
MLMQPPWHGVVTQRHPVDVAVVFHPPQPNPTPQHELVDEIGIGRDRDQ